MNLKHYILIDVNDGNKTYTVFGQAYGTAHEGIQPSNPFTYLPAPNEQFFKDCRGRWYFRENETEIQTATTPLIPVLEEAWKLNYSKDYTDVIQGRATYRRFKDGSFNVYAEQPDGGWKQTTDHPVFPAWPLTQAEPVSYLYQDANQKLWLVDKTLTTFSDANHDPIEPYDLASGAPWADVWKQTALIRKLLNRKDFIVVQDLRTDQWVTKPQRYRVYKTGEVVNVTSGKFEIVKHEPLIKRLTPKAPYILPPGVDVGNMVYCADIGWFERVNQKFWRVPTEAVCAALDRHLVRNPFLFCKEATWGVSPTGRTTSRKPNWQYIEADFSESEIRIVAEGTKRATSLKHLATPFFKFDVAVMQRFAESCRATDQLLTGMLSAGYDFGRAQGSVTAHTLENTNPEVEETLRNYKAKMGYIKGNSVPQDAWHTAGQAGPTLPIEEFTVKEAHLCRDAKGKFFYWHHNGLPVPIWIPSIIATDAELKTYRQNTYGHKDMVGPIDRFEAKNSLTYIRDASGKFWFSGGGVWRTSLTPITLQKEYDAWKVKQAPSKIVMSPDAAKRMESMVQGLAQAAHKQERKALRDIEAVSPSHGSKKAIQAKIVTEIYDKHFPQPFGTLFRYGNKDGFFVRDALNRWFMVYAAGSVLSYARCDAARSAQLDKEFP